MLEEIEHKRGRSTLEEQGEEELTTPGIYEHHIGRRKAQEAVRVLSSEGYIFMSSDPRTFEYSHAIGSNVHPAEGGDVS